MVNLSVLILIIQMVFNLGTVYTITKKLKLVTRIAHLINLVGITENKWNSAVNSTTKLTNIQALCHLVKNFKDQAEHANITGLPQMQ